MLTVGYVGLILGFGLLGLTKASHIKKRPREIREMIHALSLLDTEIFWGVTPLPEAFSLLKERIEDPWRWFFAFMEEEIRQGNNASYAWEKASSLVRRKSHLLEDDWQIIRSIGKGIGRSDRNEQHKQLQLSQKYLADAEEKARFRADSQAKMWSYLGFLSGMALVIIII